MAKEVYWHLPGFYYFFYLNQIIINLMEEYPEKFNEGYKVASVYGTFPGAIWNGGRAVFGITSKGDMEKIVSTYNKLNVPVRFTWTNSLLTEKHLNDTYCNLIMDIANNGMNQVLVNSPVLEDYLKKTYPDFKYLSSTTKRIVDPAELMAELEKDYYLVVLDYDLNRDEEVLKAIEPKADRIEILVDEVCFPHCKKRVDHYKDESLMQLTFENGTCFDCPNKKGKPSFADCMKRPHFISAEEVSSYANRGFVNFKLVGRGLPRDMVIESYLYYLVLPGEREYIKDKISKTLNKILGK